MVYVIFFEGMHGIGKTYWKNHFKKTYETLDEKFEKKNKLHPQGFLNESHWLTCLVQRILGACKKYWNPETKLYDKPGTIICDRSPYSACIYCLDDNSNMLQRLAKESMFHLESVGINPITVLFDTENLDDVMKNIKKRLEQEKWRIGLGEDDMKHLEKIKKKYKKLDCWNIDFDPTKDNLDEIIGLITK